MEESSRWRQIIQTRGNEGKNDQADTSTVSVSSTSASLLGNSNDNIFCTEDD